jgi:tetratricopeptide (TPR) repeat protein
VDRPGSVPLRRCVPLAAALALLVGCASTGGIPEDREAAFTYAVARQRADEPALAAAAAWRYYAGATPDDPRYDRALRLLARSAEALDLSWAASLWYLDVARARRDPELLPEALRGLRRIIDSGVYDADTLVDGFLATTEITGLPPDLQGFVDYQRGLHNARQQLDAWAAARFADLPEAGGWRARADYVGAVQRVAARDLEKATEALDALAERDDLPPDLDVDVRRALARVAMEQGRYDDALAQYERLRALAPDDPSLLLEMAWAHYHRGETRRTLGLLRALDAPVYQDLIAPERFLLEALALRRLCQFGPARRAATRLRARHGDALDDLYAGGLLTESGALRAAAKRRPGVEDLSRFVDRVAREKARVDDLADDLGPELYPHLRDLYDRGLREARRRLDARLAHAVDAVGEDLLAAEEGVRLILHELSVALLRGRRRPAGPPEAPPPDVRTGGGRVVFHDTGEFWTDELDDLIVVARDRCID